MRTVTYETKIQELEKNVKGLRKDVDTANKAATSAANKADVSERLSKKCATSEELKKLAKVVEGKADK